MLLASLFPDKPVSAFSVHRLLFSSGLCLAFAASPFMPVIAKLCILTVTLVLAILLFFPFEFKIRLDRIQNEIHL